MVAISVSKPAPVLAEMAITGVPSNISGKGPCARSRLLKSQQGARSKEQACIRVELGERAGIEHDQAQVGSGRRVHGCDGCPRPRPRLRLRVVRRCPRWVTGKPPRSRCTSMTSRVVPAVAATMAASRPVYTVDTCLIYRHWAVPGEPPGKPSRRRSPRRVVSQRLGPCRRRGASSAARASGPELLPAAPPRRNRSRPRYAPGPRTRRARQLSIRVARARHPSGAAPAAAVPPSRHRPDRRCLRPGSDRICRRPKARRLNSPGSAGRKPSATSASASAVGHRSPAMQMQLGHVLAGEGMRRREPGRDPSSMTSPTPSRTVTRAR